ncbi:MAG TPA: transglycosylase family protein [Thermoleophilaceae bacterium]|nr:transglycosylase family protein [Thermoleophilaceae bacterium]
MSSLARGARSSRLPVLALVLTALLCASGLIAASAAQADRAGSTGAMTTEIVLKKGDRGKAVSAVQRKLGLKADGVFGSATARAVKRFQKRNDLEADGVVGPATRRALSLPAFKASSVKRGKKRKSRTKIPAALARIAECESGGDITAVSSNGMYFGKYQFSKATWKAQGGKGSNPAEASEAEQDRVALKLYKASDPSTQWPACSRQT